MRTESTVPEFKAGKAKNAFAPVLIATGAPCIPPGISRNDLLTLQPYHKRIIPQEILREIHAAKSSYS
jgi:hypothetical protein